MQQILSKIRELTGKKFIQLTERGNKSIRIALALARNLGKTKVLIQDQGGWVTFRQFPKKYRLDLVELKTNYGLIDLTDLKEKADEESVLLVNSMPGYLAEENMEEIVKLCNEKKCIVISDVSGSIGTDTAVYGDIIFASFGKWKPVELGYGGFIATDDELFYQDFDASYFDEKKYDELLKKIDELPNRLLSWQLKRSRIIADFGSMAVIHRELPGINVAVKFKDDNEKERIVQYCKKNQLEFTECPKYIRVKDNAISIEVKRLN